MTQPWVTLVTPAYNQAEYLRETMLSVLAQDYPNLEYIVIDDGSADETLSVAQAVAAQAEERVTVLTQANQGQSATLNRGWAMSKGQLLGYLSSDDRLCPSAVTQLVKALLEGPAAVAYGDFGLIDPAGRRIREVHARPFDRRELLEELICAPGVGALFRREVFDATGGWDVRRRQTPDFEFWLRACEFGDFVRVPHVLGDYRIHEGSASFMAMSEDRADELLHTLESHWAARPSASALMVQRSLARAHCLAGKNHAQSGRLMLAFRRYARAFQMRPELMLEVGVWRQIAVGILRRLYFGWRFR